MSLLIGLISLVILPSNSYAQTSDVNTVTICFSEEQVKKMVVELESVEDYKEQIELLKQANDELTKQILALKEINKLQQEQLKISEQTIESYKKLLDTQKEAFEKELKNKSGIWDKILVGLGSLGVGLLVGLLL